ncbi:alpha/beta fold hydrolase [Pararobbsia silviterrae]|uniref:Alpha/beta hydrolase n=1 Tax=Pararobbsia silviterrae TaxID=1792498 RepID=A0A494YE99_9BURK|nr:alpha/beta hydrolase [Pararobbsia silviterrae]RKP58673.1 alpha/beta hydrolase [Pararobbsia silviterrae]
MNIPTPPAPLVDHEVRYSTGLSGITIPYVERGSGEPLLFIHGSLCDYRYWTSQLAPLSDAFRCIALSLSHYWPASDAGIQNAFGWANHVAEVAEFIESLDIEPVHLVGHSRGGCVAFQLAKAYPRLVKTLTLADPGGPLQLNDAVDAALPPATNTLRTRAAELIMSGSEDAGLELFVDSVSMPGTWRKSPADFRMMALANAQTLPKQFLDPLPAYSRDHAVDVRCRTLLIDGQKSPKMFRNNVEKLEEWMPFSERQTIAGASHGMNISNAGAFNRIVRQFALG